MARPPTTAIERAFLYQITHSAVIGKMMIPRVRETMFSSGERSFIARCAKDVYERSRGLLTQMIFELELGKLPESDRRLAMAEFNLVCNSSTTENCETLFAKLSDEELGRMIAVQLDKEAELLKSGNFKQLETERKRSALSTTGSLDQIRLVDYTDYKRREQTIADKKSNPDKYLGIKSGWKSFDDKTGGFFPGELTLVAGITGLGKSTFIKQLVANFVLQGKNVLLAANEEYLEQVEHKLDAVFTGIPYYKFKKADIDDTQIDEWKKVINNKIAKLGKLYIEEVPAFTDVSLVEYAFRKLEAQGVKIDIVLIDHLPLIKPIQAALSSNDEEKKTSADCKELARSLRVPVIVPTQAATCVEEKQTKGKRAGKLDVYGSRTQIHVANMFIILTLKRVIVDESNPNAPKDVVLLADIKKNRDGPAFSFTLKHKVICGQLEEIDDESGMSIAAATDSLERALKGDYTTPACASDIESPIRAVDDKISESEKDLLECLDEEFQFDDPVVRAISNNNAEEQPQNLPISEPVSIKDSNTMESHAVIEEDMNKEVSTSSALSLAEKFKMRRKASL